MKHLQTLQPNPHPGMFLATGVLTLTLGLTACADSEPVCQSNVELHEGGTAFVEPTEPFPIFVELFDGQQRELTAQISIMRGRESVQASWMFTEDPTNGTTRTVDLPAIPESLYVAAAAPYHNAEEGPYSYGVITVVTGLVDDPSEGPIENSWLLLIHKDEYAQVIDLGYGTHAYAIAQAKDRKSVQLVEVDRTGGIPVLLTAQFITDDQLVSDPEREQDVPMLIASTNVNNIEFLAVDVQQFDNNTGERGAEFGMLLQDKAQSNWHNVSISDECLTDEVPLE